MGKREKTQKERKRKIQWKHAIKNNFFMLGLLYRASPGYVIGGFVQTLLNVANSFLTNTYLYLYAINALQRRERLETVLWTVGGIFLVMLVTTVSRELFWRYSSIVSPRINRNIMRLLQDKATAVELACFERPAFYDTYVKAVQETTDRAYNVYWTMMDFVWVILNIVAVGTLIITIDPIFMLLAALPFFYTMLFGRRRNRVQHDRDMRMKELNRKNAYVERTFYLSDYAKEMRMTQMPRVLMRQMRETVDEMKRVLRKTGYSLLWFHYCWTLLFRVVVYIGAVLLAAFRTLVSKSMLVGDCFVIINSISNISSDIDYAAEVIVKVDEHSRYIDHLREFLNYEIKIPEDEQAPNAPKPEVLTLKGVGFSYEDSERYALQNVDLTVRKGERIAIVGHNGAGKSTLIKLLLRLYDPTEGEILLNGQPIRQLRLSSYRALFGCVFQDYQLFGVTVAENVLLDDCQSVEDRAAVNDAIEKSGMSKKISELPAGIDSIVTREFDKDGAVFSGGQAQKLSIARIFARDCEIVILDEPTSALDPIAEQDMYQRMFAACEGKTVIFISHRLSSATMADRIYLFENGSVTETGSHGELLAKNGTYADMWYKQAKAYEEEKNGEEASK